MVGPASQARLALTMRADLLAEFFPLLREGFFLSVTVGRPLEELFRQWGISPDYAARRITTIFLDNRAVDDIKTSFVRDGSTIALSGAMPGLVGATMRRGGYYAPMRGAMTYHGDDAEGEGAGTVRVKLFNILLPELGPAFLAEGITLATPDLAAFLADRDERFREGCKDVFLDGRPVGPELYRGAAPFAGAGTVTLKVTFREEQ